MNLHDAVNGLELQDHRVLYKKVEALTHLKPLALVLDWEVHLSFECYSSQCELVGQALLIGGLEQPRAQRPVDFDGRTDNPLSDLLAKILFVRFQQANGFSL